MQKDKVFIVTLRRPKSKHKHPKEMRSDPFWEFGSFGITGCHDRNLMNRRNAEELKGARLAFAQGGKLGTRLVYLTPQVTVRMHRNCIEAKWSPAEMPFRYGNAPILIANRGDSDFWLFGSSLTTKGRTTVEAQFASNFKTRATPIEPALADEIIRIYTRKRARAPKSSIASCYADALPWPPPIADGHRKATYKRLRRKARRSDASDLGCGQKRSRSCTSCG